MTQVAFVHDWLVSFRGGEKVLEALISLYPDAPIYTLFYDPSTMPESITGRDIRCPKILKKAHKFRKLMLPLLPHFIESLRVEGYDLVISTSSCVAKGVITPPETKHLCYLHSPMRYIWDQQKEYLEGVKHIPFAQSAVKLFTPSLRKWDVSSSDRVDRYLVNSSFVAERVNSYYQRKSVVIPPPIALTEFSVAEKNNESNGYFLAAGAFVTYKRFDIAIKACQKAGKKLIIAGSGPAESALRKIAGEETTFEIRPDDARWTELLQGAEALLFPGVEDFGMVAIEALACGTPVIAYDKGGARDFVIENETGLFFKEANSDSLASVLDVYEPSSFQAAKLTEFASGFGCDTFLDRMKQQIELMVAGERL